MKAIYFDTNIFYSIGFNVDDEVFNDVLCLAQSLEIERWATPITIGEVEAGISRRFAAVNDAYQRISNIIQRVTDDDYVNYLNIESLQNAKYQAIDEIKNFFAEKFTLIGYDSLDDSDVSTIFKDYFSSSKPFGNGNKKAEFPDAFQLELIKRNIKTKEKMMIVTTDHDFVNCGKNFVIQKSLTKAKEELLQLWKKSKLAEYEAFYLSKISPDMPADRLVSNDISDNGFLTQCMADEILWSLRKKNKIQLNINGIIYRGNDKSRFVESVIIVN
ncbi:PIN domain-containing protein [Shewanella oncorhynchi]|uniref:PIN domain-containing protein n=1 Tax=Shewanella oncorhynchi TaxID=2726434 RepID=UPI003D7BC078